MKNTERKFNPKALTGFIQHFSKNAGFTLIEVLIGSGLGILIIVVVYSSFIFGQNVYKRGVLNAELAQNGRIALDRIGREVRQTDQLTTTLDSIVPDPPQTEIMFEDGHTDIIQYIRYYLSGTDLKREQRHYYFPSDPSQWVDWNAKDNNGQSANYIIDDDQVIAQNISLINFYGEGNLIKIDLTASQNGKDIQFRTENFERNL